MSPKRFILVGTMAFAISVGSSLWSSDTSSADPLGAIGTKMKYPPLAAPKPASAADDHFRKLLGATSDEEIYEALYNGNSLADIAAAHDADVQRIIDLQIAELTEQLDARLERGSLTPAAYHAQKQELPEIIANSVHGHI